mmetsp:Transcript_95381/g.150884  ORF Transcript_95381/g.150884 Transcript_95381/m.150884 type:complete len:81 (+) Transcript_95381:813-1055(+)
MRRPLRCCSKEKPQPFVHIHLHLRTVNIVRISPEGVLKLEGDEIEAPKGEDLDEGEDPCPPELRDPLRNYERHHNPMYDK